MTGHRALADARILVTGAAGFLGANLARRLLADGAEVVAVVRPTTNLWRLREIEARVEIIRCDVRELPARTDVTNTNIDVIYHLATAAVDQRVNDVPEMLDTNVYGTYAILRTAERLHVNRFVHIGSSAEYGPTLRADENQRLAPNVEYGATKGAGTLLVGAFSGRTGLPSVILRPFSVYGPLEAPYRLVPYCAVRALSEQPIEITEGRQTRDFVYVEDVMQALVAAATAPEAVGGIFNLCTGVSTSVRDLVMAVLRIAGSRVPPVFGAHLPHATEMWKTSGNPARTERILGWRPQTPVEQGLTRTIEWFRTHLRDYADIYGR